MKPSDRIRLGASVAAAAGMTTVLATGAAIAAGGSGGVGSGGDSGGGVTTEPTLGDGTFPVIGKHTYGDGLGAGRGHEGQDLLAKCGKPVVAAQPGRVQYRKYQSAAGNYVVIDGKGRAADLVYMHLSAPASVTKGERVAEGERIGRVGDTGDATTCHLHFEMWSMPGWYEGGKPLDPAPSLHRWDRRG